MSDFLLITVRFYSGWYYASGSFPSPFRLFQAIVAGAGLSGPLDQVSVLALKWLEQRTPSIIAIPFTKSGQVRIDYVPNNDLDSIKADHRQISTIRTKKVTRPTLFDEAVPFLYVWKLYSDSDHEHAKRVEDLADRIYQVGRSDDAAWACADIIPQEELESRLDVYSGSILEQSEGKGTIDCPAEGSFESINRRYQAASSRFGLSKDGKGQTFRRRPKPRCRRVSYGASKIQFTVELRDLDAQYVPWPLEQVVPLVEGLRDACVARLRSALPKLASDIDRVLVGRKPDSGSHNSPNQRVSLVPLPSIDIDDDDLRIRRILVTIPCGCPLRTDDIKWAFDELYLHHPNCKVTITTVIDNSALPVTPPEIRESSNTWQTVTPVVLSADQRRRIGPKLGSSENLGKKDAAEKNAEHWSVAHATKQALRHAGIRARVVSVQTQREPYHQAGSRAELFAEGTRFNKHELWNLTLELDRAIRGPVVLGNGRFLGLGLMRPVISTQGVLAFSIVSGLVSEPDPLRLSRSFRRAVMARVAANSSRESIPGYFSGHTTDGSPARTERQPHLTYAYDAVHQQLLIIAPERVSRAGRQNDSQTSRLFDELRSAVEGFTLLRAGADGRLRLAPGRVDEPTHHLFTRSHCWYSMTPYVANRHARRTTAKDILKANVIIECRSRGLPRPQVEILSWRADSKSGLQGDIKLQFKNAVPGPIILGRTRHLGGGIFRSSNSRLPHGVADVS